MKTFTAEKTEKLSKFLLKVYEGDLSFSRLNKLLREKDVKVNGKRVNSDRVLNQGDEIIVYFDGEKVDNKNLYSGVYSDENILVVNKNKGVNSEFLFKNLEKTYKGLYFCHRLDRNTNGLMVFAKNEKAYKSIFNGFKNKLFEKYYIAEVYGFLKNKQGSFTDYIFKIESQNKVELFSQFVKGSKKAVLDYEVIEEKENSSVVKIKLLTGRMHQIRAQFSKRGNFVLGDGKYGNDEINKKLNVFETILTSVKLVFHFKKGDFLYYLDKKELEI